MTMTHSNRRLSLGRFLALSLVFLPGCGDDDPVEVDPTLTGEWSGQVALGGGASATIALGLTEHDAGDVTGTMTLTLAGDMSSGPVMGTHNYPDVSLNLQIVLFGMPWTGKYVARLVTEDRMEGTFSTDSGPIPATAVTMERKTG